MIKNNTANVNFPIRMQANTGGLYAKKLPNSFKTTKEELIIKISEVIDLDMALLEHDNDIVAFINNNIKSKVYYEYDTHIKTFIISRNNEKDILISNNESKILSSSFGFDAMIGCSIINKNNIVRI